MEEEDFNEAIQNVKRGISKYKEDKSYEDQVNKYIDISERYLVKMESNDSLLKITEKGRKTLNQIKNEFRKLQEQYKKESLFDSKEDEPLLLDSRSKALEGVKRLEDSNQSLLRSKQMIEDIQDQTIKTSGTLRGQRDQIIDQNTRLEQINDNTNRAGTIIGRMSRSQITTRIILLLVVIALILGILFMIGFTLWFIFRPKGSSGSGTN